MDSELWKGWEHKRRPRYCNDCGGILYEGGATDCDEEEHEYLIRNGDDYCGYCGMDFHPEKIKFPETSVKYCPKCGNLIERDKYIPPCKGDHHKPGNPEGAVFCQWCGKRIGCRAAHPGDLGVWYG